VVVASVLVTALVAAGVTLGILRLQSRTNPQQVNLRSGVTISEESAVIQVAARAKPAVVSVVTQEQPSVTRGSGFLVTSDGYIVTAVSVISGASKMTVLVTGDANLHVARLVDYDCQTGVAVLKIDQVNGLPTLVFADPTALAQGQVVVAVGGPLDGSAVTPGYVSSLHRPAVVTESGTQRSVEDQRHNPDNHGDRRRHRGRPAAQRRGPGSRRRDAVPGLECANRFWSQCCRHRRRRATNPLDRPGRGVLARRHKHRP